MDFDRLIQRVRRHLDSLGVACEVVAGEPVEDKAITKAERKMNVRLPADVRQFYRAIGEGFVFRWNANPADLNQPFAGFWVPRLSELASMYLNWRRLALFSPEEADKYGFPHTDDPALAKRTAAKMWHWLPVIEEGNGDQICLDLSDPSGEVIFNQHDWLDGGSGENGRLLAVNWTAFVTAWGSVCFQHPESHYWPNCFRPGGGVAWDGEQFREPFRIASLSVTG